MALLPNSGQVPAVNEHTPEQFIKSTTKKQYRSCDTSKKLAQKLGGAENPSATMSFQAHQSPDASDAEWTLIPPNVPSITDSGGASDDPNRPRPVVPVYNQGLTTDNLMIHNLRHEEKSLAERIWDREVHQSVIARKGTNTRMSDGPGPIDPTGPWAPVQDPTEVEFSSLGSWADVPRPSGSFNLGL